MQDQSLSSMKQTESSQGRAARDQSQQQKADTSALTKDNEKGESNQSQHQRSRMLRALVVEKSQAKTALPANSSSLDRNWTFFALIKENCTPSTSGSSGVPTASTTESQQPFCAMDMEKLFQIEASLHQKRLKNITPKGIANKAILPDIFMRQSIIKQEQEEKPLIEGIENQLTIINVQAEKEQTCSEQTPQDSKNTLEDTQKARPVIDRTSIKPPRQHRTERVKGSQVRSSTGAQQKSLIIKKRPSSATRKLILADNDSQDKQTSIQGAPKPEGGGAGLAIIRSLSSLIKPDLPNPSAPASSNQSIIDGPSELQKPPKEQQPDKGRKKITRSTSKGGTGNFASNKAKRYSIVAPQQNEPDTLDELKNNVKKSVKPLKGSIKPQFDYQTELAKLYSQEKRHIDMGIWQNLERAPDAQLNALYLATSIWNMLSKNRLALNKIDPGSIAEPSLTHLASDWFSQFCISQGVPDSSRILVSPNHTSKRDPNKAIISDVCKHLRMPIKTKAHIIKKEWLIVGYEVTKKSIQDQIIEHELILITTKSNMQEGIMLESLKWSEVQQNGVHLEEFIIGMSPG